jgi:hypothetical protein
MLLLLLTRVGLMSVPQLASHIGIVVMQGNQVVAALRSDLDGIVVVPLGSACSGKDSKT